MLKQKFEEIMQRLERVSLFEITKIPDYIRILAASWLILLKVEILNYKLREVSYNDGTNFINEYWQDPNSRLQYTAQSNFIALIVSVIISKWFHGRRLTVTYFFLRLLLVADTVLTLTRCYLYPG